MPGRESATCALLAARAAPRHVRRDPVPRSGSWGRVAALGRGGPRAQGARSALRSPCAQSAPCANSGAGRAPAGARRERGFAPPRSGGTAQARQWRAGAGREARHRAETATAANIAKRGHCTRERGLRQRGRRAGLCVGAARIVRGAGALPPRRPRAMQLSASIT